MKISTKYIIIAVVSVFIIVGATLWISDWFRSGEEKKEYNEAVKKSEELMDDLKKSELEKHTLRSENIKLLQILILKQNQNNEKYNQMLNSNLTNDQLDSLLTAFEGKPED